jgi:peroxiredoxin Q/BCP
MFHLKEKDKAPAFKGIDQNGKKVQLKDYKGKKLVLYFYPKDNTESCTNQACNLRDHYKILQKKGIEILGVSPDDETSHKKFETKYKLPFTLLVDSTTSIAQLYGFWGPKKFMGRDYIGLHRTTFLINEKGIIDKIITRPITKKHTQQILELWNEV